MKKLSAAAGALEKFFWIFLFINPFLDILNGVYINMVMGVDVLDVKFTSTLGVTPSLMIRMAMLVVFALYIIMVMDKRAIITAIPMGLAWLMSMVSEYLSLRGVSFFLDTQYTARFCYNIVVLMVYTRVFASRFGSDGRGLIEKLNTVTAFTVTVLSASILISAVIGVGYSTYADRMGFRGSRGFFYAGNDITAVLTLLLPVTVAKLMTMDRGEGRGEGRGRTLLFAAAAGLGANALLIIGSKTAFIAVGVTYALMLATALWQFIVRKNKNALFGYLWSLGGAAVFFALLMLLSGGALWDSIVSSYAVTGELAENEGVGTAILSGRQYKFSEHLSRFKAGGPMVWLFGLGRGSQSEILEMDVFEVVFYYGVFGALAFLWLYVKAAADFLRCFFTKRSITGVALAAAIGMTSGYLIIAGHVLFTVTSGFYFAFMIAYSRVFFSDSEERVRLWKN